jgi:hypothetical protein
MRGCRFRIRIARYSPIAPTPSLLPKSGKNVSLTGAQKLPGNMPDKLLCITAAFTQVKAAVFLRPQFVIAHRIYFNPPLISSVKHFPNKMFDR